MKVYIPLGVAIAFIFTLMLIYSKFYKNNQKSMKSRNSEWAN